jgi:hypothetical protein
MLIAVTGVQLYIMVRLIKMDFAVVIMAGRLMLRGVAPVNLANLKVGVVGKKFASPGTL